MAVSFLSAGYLPRYKRGMNSTLVEFSVPPAKKKIKYSKKKLSGMTRLANGQYPFCLPNTFHDQIEVGTPP